MKTELHDFFESYELDRAFPMDLDAMSASDDWVAFLSGKYQGWMRPPGGDWEDLIGSIEIELAVEKDGQAKVSITTLEFGLWTGCLRLPDGILEGLTGQGDTFFTCKIVEQGAGAEIKCCLHGGIYKPPTEMLLEFQFIGESRASSQSKQRSLS